MEWGYSEPNRDYLGRIQFSTLVRIEGSENLVNRCSCMCMYACRGSDRFPVCLFIRMISHRPNPFPAPLRRSESCVAECPAHSYIHYSRHSLVRMHGTNECMELTMIDTVNLEPSDIAMI